MKRLIAVAALLCIASAVHACPTFSRAVIVKQQAVVVAPVVQAVAVAVPAYGAGYAPAPQQQAADADTNRKIIELLHRILDKLEGGAASGVASPPATTPAIDRKALVKNACFTCHNAGTADKPGPNYGGSFVLVEQDGKYAPQSVKEQERIRNRVKAGSMPPVKSVNRPLTEAERAAVIEDLAPERN